jgi:hypothetical protein
MKKQLRLLSITIVIGYYRLHRGNASEQSLVINVLAIHIKCLLYLSNFSPILTSSIDLSKIAKYKVSRMSVQQEQSHYTRMDTYDDSNSRSLLVTFSNAPKIT